MATDRGPSATSSGSTRCSARGSGASRSIPWYTGMTLASAIGIPLAAAEPRIRAASFGGIGAHAFVLAAAREVTIPIEFLFPLDDAEITRASQLELFDAFASTEKVLLGFPGSHFRVPAERLDTRLFPRTFG